MPINNLISIEFTDAELTQIDAALASLEQVFAGKVVQLTAGESQHYGKLGNATENWSNMVYDDCQNSTVKLAPDFVDMGEWTKDETARDQLSPRATRLETLTQQVVDTNRVVGFDIYNTCRSAYNFTKYQSTQNVPGTKAYYDKWSVQFPGRPGKQAAANKQKTVDDDQKPV